MDKADANKRFEESGFGTVPSAIAEEMLQYNLADIMAMHYMFKENLLHGDTGDGDIAMIDMMDFAYKRFIDLKAGEFGYALLGVALSLIATFFNIDAVLKLHSDINDIENGRGGDD